MDNPYQPPAIPPDHVEWDYDRRPEDRRPTAVTVLGILNIVFSSLALLCVPVNIIFLAVPMPGLQVNPGLQITQDPIYRTGMIGLYVFGLVPTIVELISGIGLLRMRPWGRSLALIYVCLAVISSMGHFVFNWTYFIPAMKGRGDAAAAGAAMGAMIGGTLAPLLWLIYPFVLLVFMLTPSVARALERNRFPEDDSPALKSL